MRTWMIKGAIQVFGAMAITAMIATAGLSQPADGIVGTLDHGLLALGSGRVCVFEKDGTITRAAKTGNNADAWHLENGNILFADGKVTELDKNGKVVWQYQPDCKRADGAMSCQRLANVGQVEEVTSKGEVVWDFNKTDLPELNIRNMTGIHVLKNGNMVIGNYSAYDKAGKGVGMFEITREKKLVWTYVSPERKDKSMMAVQKLDGDFNPMR